MPRPCHYRLSQMDAVDWLRSLPDASVDLVVTDPPYESLEKHRAVGTTTRLKHSKASSNDWFRIFPNARFPELFAEVWRVLRKNRHFYLFCDPETMFVAKPLGEEAGFKFWKPLVWDKCLAPDTPVWTTRGVRPLGDIVVGDEVALPEGGVTRVRATRRVRADALRLRLSDGSTVVSSRDHRFVLADGRQVDAASLEVGSELLTRPVRTDKSVSFELATVVPDDELVLELPDPRHCLFCDRVFDSTRAAAAHQARFCDRARSKAAMARELGLSPKRLRRWLTAGHIPALWARRLGIADLATGRVRLLLQNDSARWYPERVALDYDLGKLVGLFAAEGSFGAEGGAHFALHSDEKHLRHHIARYVRKLGARARLHSASDGCTVVDVSFRLVGHLIRAFVGGERAFSKYFTPLVYGAPDEFRRGVLAGLIEGDGHWSDTEQRETLNVASLDLALFARRSVEQSGGKATISRFENDHAGGWRVRFDPRNVRSPLRVIAREEAGFTDLVDVSIEDPDELFLLGNGVVTHNCKIGMGYHYRARYECVLFFEKGKRKLEDLGVPDIIEVPRVYRGYPAEKPPEVSEVLIGQSTEEGELVVDPFCGSGSVGVAAARLGRDFLGNDVCLEAIEIAEGRLREAGAVLDARAGFGPDVAPAQLGLGLGARSK